MCPHPLAGTPAPQSLLINIQKLVTAYFATKPDVTQPEQKVAFGTSGHRGCSADASFNEYHILAIAQALCEVRAARGISGPLFVGIDTHALSEPALATTLEVMAANDITVLYRLGRRLHPDTGYFACNTHVQQRAKRRSGRRRCNYPFAQSANRWGL